MSRINYTEEQDYSGQFELWQSNCRRSLCGKRGQAELRLLRDALMALPDKRLIHGSLFDEDGDVCAIGAYAKHKGLDLTKFAADDATDEVGIEAGMPALVAWKVVEMNDLQFGLYADGKMTPEVRYEQMIKWVNEQILA